MTRSIAVLLASATLACSRAQAADDDRSPETLICPRLPPPPCTKDPHYWLRRPYPYELGDLTALGPWRVYLVAEGQDTSSLQYGAWGWGDTCPLYFGPALISSDLGPVVELATAGPYPFPGMMYWLWAFNQQGECSLQGVMVPFDHSQGQ